MRDRPRFVGATLRAPTLKAVCATAKKAIQVLGASLALSLICLPAFPQAELCRITGSVADQTGSVIPGATLTVTDVQRGVSRALTSDGAGQYFAPGLLPGTNTVRVEFKGFKTVERQNVVLEVGQEIRVDFVLQPGDSEEQITVVEALPLINTTDAVLGGTLSNATINDLPLNGRNYQALLTLRPGVVAYPGGGAWTQSTNGVRPDGMGWMVDGQLNADPGDGRSVMGVQSPITDAATILPIDAIQEFNLQVNPKAESGWKPCALVNVGIRSGTNSLHGTAYAFGRDGSWDARNYFNPAPDAVPPLNLVQYGATAGGPIKKDKLFYFGGYETLHDELGAPQFINAPITRALPTPNVKTSVPDAIAALQAAGVPISSVSQKLLSLYPTNNSTSTQVATAFSNSNTSYNGIGKINYHINDRHNISGMLFWGDYFGIGADNVYANELFLLHVPVKSVANNYNWMFTPNSRLVNEARFGFNRMSQTLNAGDVGTPAIAYGLNTGVTDPVLGGLPVIQISGFNFLGAVSARPGKIGPSPFYRWADHVSYFRGRHAFKFGGELGRADAGSASYGGGRGELDFQRGGQTFHGSSTLEDFLAGKPSAGKLLVTKSTPLRTMRRWMYAGFAQDDWRVTPQLTLNLGLRYEYSTPPGEENNLLGNFDPTLGLVQIGKQISSIYKGDHKDFSPRVGIAWDVTGKGTTVLRAGGSIMYETLSMGTLNIQSLQNFRGGGLTKVPTGANLNGVPGAGDIALATFTYAPSQLKYPLAPGATATIFPLGAGTVDCTTASPCNIVGIDQNFRTPFVSTWTAGIQHAFTNNLSLEVTYVGNHGSRLVGPIDLNAPPAGAGYCMNSPLTAAQIAAGCSSASPAELEQAARPFNTQFPYLKYINWISNLDRSNYNGLQTTLTKRVSRGLSVNAGYTYSHSLDSGSLNFRGDLLPQNSALRSRDQEYGNSDFDIRHRLTLAVTYAIPGKKTRWQALEGWQINSILTLQTPQPWLVNDTGDDISGSGDFGDRWNFFGNADDFKSRGPNATPYFDGTSNPKCLAKASATGPGAVSTLKDFGCYAAGDSIMLPPALGTFGNMGRNIFRDTSFKNLDLSAYKNWKFGERFRAQFRAEFFNVLNHPNFSNPYGSASGFAFNDPSAPGAFGCGCATPDIAAGNPIVGSGSNRAIQLGVKLIF